MANRIRFIFTLTSMFFSLLSFGLQEPILKNYTVNDGLASSQVYDIVQDDKGYIWFATDRGLSRYNGYTFKSYSTRDGLTSNCVLRFFRHDDGTIWCITAGNKLFYIDQKGAFKAYKYNHVIYEVVQDNTISQLLIYKDTFYIGFINLTGYIKIDKAGTLENHTEFVLNDNSVIVSEKIGEHQISYKLPSKEKHKSIFKNSEQYILQSNKSCSFFETASIKNRAFISNEFELYLIHNGLQTRIQKEKEPIGIGVYDASHFWVGFRYGGINIYDLKGNKTQSILSEKSVTRVFKDHEGGVWVSTLNSGIFYFNDNSIVQHKLNANENNHVHSLTANEKGELFVGYYNGLIYKWDGNKLKLVYKSTLKKPSKVQYYKSLNKVITHADNMLFDIETNTIYNNIYLLSLSDEKEGPLSFSSINQFVIGKSSYRTYKRGHDISISPYDTIISSIDGVFKYKNSSLVSVNNDDLFKNRVDDVDYFNGKYYAASLGAGIIIFDQNTFFNIGTKEGLYSDLATEVLVENDSVIWACTNNGLNRVSINKDNTYSIKGVSNIDGLASNEVFDVEVIGDKVWVATAKGLCSFNKDLLKNKEEESPNYYLSIKDVFVNDKQLAPIALEHLSYKQNRIQLRYQAISFYYKDLVYRYRLEGLEEQWNFTKGLSFTYPSLPTGRYNLVLQVKGELGQWDNNQLVIPIIISPAFYTTWWFYSIITVLSTLLVFLFFKYNILSYNRDIMRGLLRKVLKFTYRDTPYLFVNEAGKEVKVKTADIWFVKASGNYLEIHTAETKFVIREKISNFKKRIPDPVEFLRVHRSYIIRVDKVDKENNKFVYIKDKEIPVGGIYKKKFKKILI